MRKSRNIEKWMKNLKDVKNANIGVQTFFYIFMSLIMIWIIYFGYKNIVLVDNEISNQDKMLIEQKLESAVMFCKNPINKGSSKFYEFDNKKFNSICIINSSTIPIMFSSPIYSGSDDDIELIKNSLNHNKSMIVLLDASYTSTTPHDVLNDYIIVSTIEVDIGFNSYCNFDGADSSHNGYGKPGIKIVCN